MGIIDRLTAPSEKRAMSLSQAAQLAAQATVSDSGVLVTDWAALSCTAVAACTRLLAETISSLPLHVYERGAAGRKRAEGHALQSILGRAPNVLMSAFSLRESLQAHLCLRGNAYAMIERRHRGVAALWPLRPDRMRVDVGEDELGRTTVVYEYQRASGGTIVLNEADVFHLRGLGGDGIVGLSPVTLHRQAIGLALATEESGARFFRNGTRPTGVYKHPGTLSPDAFDRLKESLEQANSGLANTGKSILLEEGMDWSQVSLSHEDSQYLETRQFQAQEIARMYRVPPHMIGATSGESMTYSNTEQASLELVTYTLLPWLVRWEQEIERKLLSPAERDRYYVKHNVDGLLRADLRSRYESYRVGILAGFLTRNEARAKEELEPLAGLDIPVDPQPSRPQEGSANA